MILSGLTGLWADGLFPRLGLVLAGLGLLSGCGGTLILSYGKASQSDVFPIQVLIRVGFLLVGPGGVLMEMPGLLMEHGPWVCLAGSATTVLPSGLALVVLLVRRKRA